MVPANVSERKWFYCSNVISVNVAQRIIFEVGSTYDSVSIFRHRVYCQMSTSSTRSFTAHHCQTYALPISILRLQFVLQGRLYLIFMVWHCCSAVNSAILSCLLQCKVWGPARCTWLNTLIHQYIYLWLHMHRCMQVHVRYPLLCRTPDRSPPKPLATDLHSILAILKKKSSYSGLQI